MSRFNAFSTTNSTYGSFYQDLQKKVKEDQEKQKRFSNPNNNMISTLRNPNNYHNDYNDYNNKNYHNNKSYNNNRVRTPNMNLKDSSLVGSIACSLTGLQNLRNTCYINTCLQNLIHCTPFISQFLEISNTIFQKNIRDSPISNEFYELLIQIYENNNSEQTFVDPTSFVNKFLLLHNQFYLGQEHDTQEFCRFFLQDLNCELNEIVSPSNYKKELPRKNKKEMFFNYKNDCLSKESSIITHLFIGYFSFEYNCECGYKEYSFSQFLDLPVQMNSGINGYDLFQMLQDNFYRKSYVDMGENCSFCKRTSKKNEIMRIASLPQILIISLQRINPITGKKNNCNVRFYEGLDLREIIDAEISDGSSTKYDLFAISNHIGEINTGHYYSNIKINNNWYCFEDSKVYKIGSRIEMTSNEVYTLFYTRNNSR